MARDPVHSASLDIDWLLELTGSRTRTPSSHPLSRGRGSHARHTHDPVFNISDVPRGGVYDTDTDTDIERLAAEAGYDIDVLKCRRRGRPLIGSGPVEVVPVRLDPELRAAVEARAAADRTTTSDVISDALRGFLDIT